MTPYVESRHLRYVIAVAEEGNVTRAAKRRLYIAAPSLAREIRQLEARLGYKLFERHWRGVSLTPAGEIFVEEARKSLAHMQRAADRGAAVSRGETGVLVVGYTPLLDLAPLIELRQRFADSPTLGSLEFRSTYCSEQLELVLSETLQAGLVMLPVEAEELRTHCVWSHRLVVAVSERSPLAASGPLLPADLSAEPAVWLKRSVNPVLYEQLLHSCQEAGWVPRIAHEVSTYDELLDAVGTGIGLGLVTELMARRLQAKGVVFCELADPGLAVQTGVIYRANNSSKNLLALLRVLKDLGNCKDVAWSMPEAELQ